MARQSDGSELAAAPLGRTLTQYRERYLEAVRHWFLQKWSVPIAAILKRVPLARKALEEAREASLRKQQEDKDRAYALYMQEEESRKANMDEDAAKRAKANKKRADKRKRAAAKRRGDTAGPKSDGEGEGVPPVAPEPPMAGNAPPTQASQASSSSQQGHGDRGGGGVVTRNPPDPASASETASASSMQNVPKSFQKSFIQQRRSKSGELSKLLSAGEHAIRFIWEAGTKRDFARAYEAVKGTNAFQLRRRAALLGRTDGWPGPATRMLEDPAYWITCMVKGHSRVRWALKIVKVDYTGYFIPSHTAADIGYGTLRVTDCLYGAVSPRVDKALFNPLGRDLITADEQRERRIEQVLAANSFLVSMAVEEGYDCLHACLPFPGRFQVRLKRVPAFLRRQAILAGQLVEKLVFLVPHFAEPHRHQVQPCR